MAALVVLCVIAGAGGVAQAGRKRVVVLDFEGPKADKFHDDLVKLIKKTHTVVPTEKWNGTAEEMGAGAPSENNLKKVAKKLKIDAIVEGKIEKRRDAFILHIKLREGRSGELVGNTIDTKAEGPRIDGRAQRDLKDELIEVIGNVESNHLGGGADDGPAASARKGAKQADDDDEKPAVKKAARQAARKADDDDDDRPVKKAAKQTDDDGDDGDDRPMKKAFSKHAVDQRGSEKVANKGARKPGDDDDELPAGKKAGRQTADDEDRPAVKKAAKRTAADELPAKRKAAKQPDDDDELPANKLDGDDDDKRGNKTVASRDGDGDGDGDGNGEVDAEAGAPVDAATALSPGERALDAVLGASVSVRRMSFAIRPGLMMRPPAYKGTPVGGAMIDATVYPLAVGHKRSDFLKNLGLNVMYDRVLKVNSKDAAGNVYPSTEARYGVGAVFRYALHRTAMAPVVIGSLGYSRQAFTISSGTTIGIPNVKYSIIEPGAGLRYPLTPKLCAGVDAKFMLIASAGQIETASQYGPGTVLGVEGALGADYLITPNLFARAAFRFETIGFAFKGTGTLANMRDGDPTTTDVPGARDSYFGGIATVGYLY